ncbi:hypothetical protein D3C75_1241830 [compost metagenome]
MLAANFILVQEDGITVCPVILMRIGGQHMYAVNIDVGCAEFAAVGILEDQEKNPAGDR